MGPTDIKKPSTKWAAAFQGSIAMRVLLVSFVFIVVPLIFYSYFIYEREYRGRLKDIFTGLNIVQADHLQYLRKMERFQLDYLYSMREIIELREQTSAQFTDEELGPIFLQFAQSENITALFYLKTFENGDIYCIHSTLPEYLNRKFNDYVDLHRVVQEYDRVYIGPDPLFGHSMVVFTIVYKPGTKEISGILGISIALDQLITELSWLKTTRETHLSILGNDFSVLATTNPDLVQETIKFENLNQEYAGYKFFAKGQERYAVYSNIPATNEYLMISLPEKQLIKQFNLYLRRFSILMLFILVIGTLASYLLSLRMTKPLKQLKNVMESVGHGDLEKEYVYDKMGFEINLLGSSFNEMRIDLGKYIEEAKVERAFKEAYAKELQIAHEIQNSILPLKEVGFSPVDISVYFSPAKEVAGDYYDWFINQEEENLQLTVADGSGKGIMACLYALDLRSLIRAYTEQKKSLKETVLGANKMFCIDTKESGSFVTAFICRYSNQTKILEYVSCGHNPPILKRNDGTIEKLVTHGIALGVEENPPVEVKSLTLQPGDVIFFYTDGITDAHNIQKELYTEERLIKLIEQGKEDNSKAWLSRIIADTSAFSKGEDQYDDMTLLVMKIL
ncbi:MAG: HAMP domain-containing protein [Chlamydiae bacterium]|nr:HAMP domain-containing protein [Chlamydiota bacterium]